MTEKVITKARAHAMVTYAIRTGKLTPAQCEKCGNSNALAHHDDYAEPLTVRWLCDIHHAEWHRKHGPGLHGFGTRASGKHKSKRVKLSASAEQWREWELAAKDAGKNLTAWIRSVLDAAS
jgi:ribosomal protein S27AE